MNTLLRSTPQKQLCWIRVLALPLTPVAWLSSRWVYLERSTAAECRAGADGSVEKATVGRQAGLRELPRPAQRTPTPGPAIPTFSSARPLPAARRQIQIAGPASSVPALLHESLRLRCPHVSTRTPSSPRPLPRRPRTRSGLVCSRESTTSLRVTRRPERPAANLYPGGLLSVRVSRRNTSVGTLTPPPFFNWMLQTSKRIIGPILAERRAGSCPITQSRQQPFRPWFERVGGGADVYGSLLALHLFPSNPASLCR